MKHLSLFEEFKDKDPEAEVRNRGDVVFPSESSKVKDDKDHFPINNKDQARNALARVNQYDKSPKWYDGTLEEVKNKVYKAVEDKFPIININED